MARSHAARAASIGFIRNFATEAARDGIRAAISHEPFDLTAESPVGLWGYSGGGLASAWAAEVQESYAPELNIVGAVLGSPVGDLGHTFRRLNGSLYAGLPALVVAALSHIYPDLDRVIDEHVTDEGREMLTRIQRMTTAHALVWMAGKEVGRVEAVEFTEFGSNQPDGQKGCKSLRTICINSAKLSQPFRASMV